MCTAISFKTVDHYFGRTLDLEYHYNESVVITPRNYPLKFTSGKESQNHFAIIGIATVVDDYPLYYEATNEKGLSVAGLNFPHNAHYFPVCDNKENVAPFEFIPWVLCQSESVDEVTDKIKSINLADVDFNKELKNTPLHWIIADKSKSITVECAADGMKIYNNTFGVLTNNPPFEWQIKNYEKTMHSLGTTESDPKMNSKGLESIGLPGDFSSPSRFTRIAFIKKNSVCGKTEEQSVTQFFHILGCVNTPSGIIKVDSDKQYKTVYTSCCNTDKGIFYFTTYENSQISVVDMHRENLEKTQLITYPLITEQQINQIN